MAADSTAYDAVLKEVWHPDRLESQLYQENPTLESLEKRQPSAQHGDKVVTPIHTGRGGGYSVVPRAGSSNLNEATSQELNQASWTYTHHWQQIAIESNTIDETSGNANAVAQVVETEVQGALDDLRKQISRQVFGNGDSLIAECDTTSASTTVELLTTGYGYDAIVRGHLHADLVVDIGTTASETSVAADRTITAVKEDSADPDITISGAAVTTAAGDYVSIANSRSGTTSYEMNGLRDMVGSTTSVLGGIDPATVTNWKPAQVDSTTTSITLPKTYELQRSVMQKTGRNPDWVLTSLKQQENLYKLAQPQVRFQGDASLGAGNVGGFSLNGMKIDAVPDCYDRLMFFLTRKCLFLVRTEKPKWAPAAYEGGSGILRWKQDTTQFVSALVYRIEFALDRRNANAAFTALTD